MPLLRKIIFYLFCAIYLIVCPLLVLRMLGYVISPSTHRLVKTGLVYISTNPPGANVFVNGRPAHEKTPTAIRDLVPGQHFLRIEKDGYLDWAQNTTITPNKATVIENILLTPRPLKNTDDI